MFEWLKNIPVENYTRTNKDYKPQTKHNSSLELYVFSFVHFRPLKYIACITLK